MTVLDPDTAEQAARKLLDVRVVSVGDLAARRAHLDRLRTELADAERADAAAWAAAEKAGWTDTELRQVGFTAPTRRGPGRPRRSAVDS